VLRHLEASDERPWVATTADLLAVLRNLLSETRPASIHDLELLFHSCRQRVEVTTETLVQLERRWNLTSSETAQHRVLSVIERLAESQDVLMAEHRRTLTQWMRAAEHTSREIIARIGAGPPVCNTNTNPGLLNASTVGR
jgi:hypothetical protein